MEPSAFEKLLLETFPTWERNLSPDRGLKRIEMSQSGLLSMLDEPKARALIQTMKERLPEDTAFRNESGTRFENWIGTHGTGSDLYYVIFASEEWKQVNQGEDIPSVFIDSWL